MQKVTKEFTFAAAHLLTGHEGLCKNLHGHEYVVQVDVISTDIDYPVVDNGPAKAMVVDFKELKTICNELFDQYDHAFVYDINQIEQDQAESALIKVATDFQLRTVAFPGRPTAEKMSEVFYHQLNDKFTAMGLKVTEVRVWETPTSFATYNEGGC